MLVLLHPWLFFAKKILTRPAFLDGPVRLKTCYGNSSKKNLHFLLIDVEQYFFFFMQVQCVCGVGQYVYDYLACKVW